MKSKCRTLIGGNKMTKTKWNVDAAHSEIGFSVKHMMISRAKGTFNDFEADIEMDPNNLEDANIKFKIDVKSIDTKNEDSNNHILSIDFNYVYISTIIIYNLINIKLNIV